MKPICFAIGQLNPTVGDYPANTEKILRWITEADQKGADIIVFPEMSLPGYPVWDLANKKDFIQEGLKALDKIAAATRKLHITAVVGYIDSGNHPSDDRNYNALAWIEKGKIKARYFKRLLPTYDVFLENIFFAPGTESFSIPWNGMKIGPTICEDIWDDRYGIKPVADLAKQKVDLLLNISASPYYRGVAEARENLAVRHAKKSRLPFLYVNQIGAQDDLVFDGRSFFADAQGRVLFRAPAFHEGLFYFKYNPKNPPRPAPLPERAGSIAEVYDALVLGIRDYCRKNGFQKTVIGLSGGIDSALVAALAVDALGPGAVLGVTMPGTYSSEGSWKDSQDLAKRLGIRCVVHPIKKKYEAFIKESQERQKKEGLETAPGKITLAMENLQARLRGLELMYISNDQSRLVLTTGNKSELAMGYCTLYGDMAGGLAVIGDVYKTDVYRLSEYRNSLKPVIPKAILEKAPSAELRPNQKDQDSLPPYEVLDEILKLYIEENQSAENISKSISKKFKVPKAKELVAKVMSQVDHNEYKRRQTPPILRVTRKAWFGRRMPITNRFKHA